MANTSSWENHTYKLVNFVCCFAHQICQGKLMVVRLDRINTILMTYRNDCNMAVSNLACQERTLSLSLGYRLYIL